MAQPRYNAALQNFLRDWKPNEPELDRRFIDAVRVLLAAVLQPPEHVFEVETILSPVGGRVVVRLADYEAQLDPLDAHHLALSLVEAAASARTESWLMRWIKGNVSSEINVAAGIVGDFRKFRTEEMQRELDGDLAKRSAPAGGKP